MRQTPWRVFEYRKYFGGGSTGAVHPFGRGSSTGCMVQTSAVASHSRPCWSVKTTTCRSSCWSRGPFRRLMPILFITSPLLGTLWAGGSVDDPLLLLRLLGHSPLRVQNPQP